MSDSIRLEVSIDEQCLDVYEGVCLIRRFPVSTGEKGMGFAEGSFRTPWGRFRVVEKIGDGETIGTVFKARIPVGVWQPGEMAGEDLILTRILRIEGLDDANSNTLQRCVYIHGTHREDLVGIPASHGCIRLSNADVVELFDLVEVGAELVIHPRTRRWGKLVFFDCDSTLSTIEGIDELGRLCGSEVHRKVVELTDAAMNGDIPISEVFGRRMEIIRPDRAICEEVANLYLATVVPGMPELIRELKELGWIPVILSGGFAPLIRPLADLLGVSHVEAVPLYHDEKGCYAGYGEEYPTTRNLGKNEVIREWRGAMKPEHVAMIGDGVSDLETLPDVDTFIGFGGVVARKRVQQGARHWIGDVADIGQIKDVLCDSLQSRISS